MRRLAVLVGLVVSSVALAAAPAGEVGAWPTECRTVADPLTTASRCEGFYVWGCCHRAVHLCRNVNDDVVWQRGQWVWWWQTSRTNPCGTGDIVFRGHEIL